MRLPLSGITVLSLEQAIAAPLGSRHLAELGLPLGYSADREAPRS